ncbi:hypothetical protein [Sphingomonas sp. KR3-1]|uniref:hypothetical protein n=1 Tax=Sphingomonas sp. KR3-1 TaxID=3156611 RepID=UPI0032B5F3E6
MIGNAFRVRPGYWFRPKRFGFGAVPVTWQGWLVTLAFAGLAAILANFATHRGPAWLVLLVPLTIAFLWLVVVKTDGDWQFRWGGDD